jgi:hypothetical protein
MEEIMNLNEMNSKNTPMRWKISGKYLANSDQAQLNRLNPEYKAVLVKAATFTSLKEMGIGNQPGVGSEPDPILVTGLNITEQDGSQVLTEYDMALGTDLNIAVIVTPTNAYNKNVVFTSSDDDVAKVSATYGLIQLVGVGTVEITATATDDSDVTDSVVFDVVDNR